MNPFMKPRPFSIAIIDATNDFLEKIMNTSINRIWLPLIMGMTVLLIGGCRSMKTPATSSVAVSKTAVDSAAAAGAAQYAPLEMNSAREKLDRANRALQDKDYKLANDLANQAQADARLAQSKANSEKAQAAAATLQEDIRVLRDELQRTGHPQPAPAPSVAPVSSPVTAPAPTPVVTPVSR